MHLQYYIPSFLKQTVWGHHISCTVLCDTAAGHSLAYPGLLALCVSQ